MYQNIEINESVGFDGIIRELGDLPLGAIINEEGLAKIFRRHQVSIKRAVQRSELPPPIRMMGAPVWTIESLLQYINNRLSIALKEKEKFQKKIGTLDI
ncbi:MAG: hypothetical protein JEZ07_19555 [Phycisphaerae bacterium]|nr:hypothetical protein [Phycisphaerae bacterium]